MGSTGLIYFADGKVYLNFPGKKNGPIIVGKYSLLDRGPLITLRRTPNGETCSIGKRAASCGNENLLDYILEETESRIQVELDKVTLTVLSPELIGPLLGNVPNDEEKAAELYINAINRVIQKNVERVSIALIEQNKVVETLSSEYERSYFKEKRLMELLRTLDSTLKSKGIEYNHTSELLIGYELRSEVGVLGNVVESKYVGITVVLKPEKLLTKLNIIKRRKLKKHLEEVVIPEFVERLKKEIGNLKFEYSIEFK